MKLEDKVKVDSRIAAEKLVSWPYCDSRTLDQGELLRSGASNSRISACELGDVAVSKDHTL